jgi:hypothetical protein
LPSSLASLASHPAAMYWCSTNNDNILKCHIFPLLKKSHCKTAHTYFLPVLCVKDGEHIMYVSVLIKSAINILNCRMYSKTADYKNYAVAGIPL